MTDPLREAPRSARRPRGRGGAAPAWLWWAGLAGVALALLAAHGPALGSQALCIDDDAFLTSNRLVRQPGWHSIERFFGEVLSPSTVGGYYIPLAMTSLMVDSALGGRPDDLQPFHRTALLLHIANTLLLIVLFYQLFHSLWPALLTGLLFGVHPLTVEPVAWIGERKTLLAAFFTLISLVLYLRHIRGGRDRLSLAGSLVAFLLALLSKPTSLPLPVLLLLLDAWPLRRLGRAALIEKIPYFALAALSLVVALISHARTASLGVFATYTPLQGALLAVYKLVFYLAKFVWPASLTPVYVPPQPFTLGHPVVLASLALLLALAAVVLVSLRRTRALLVAALFYLFALAPTLGGVQYSWVILSDKYLYPLPLIGLLLLVAQGLSRLWGAPGGEPGAAAGADAGRSGAASHVGAASHAGDAAHAGARDRRARWAAAGLVALLAVAALSAARAQYGHWRSTEDIYRHMLRHAPEEALLHSNYALELERQGRYEDARRSLEEAARRSPGDARILANLGTLLVKLGRPQEALPRYEAALAAGGEPDQLHSSIGNVLVTLGRLPEAREHFAEALRLNPRSGDAHTNLGRALALQGDIDGAIASFRQAVACDPLAYVAEGNLGGLLARRGDHAAAIPRYEAALRIEPRFAEGHSNLAVSLAALGRLEEAARHYRQAIQLAPQLYQAQRGLGDVLAARGLWREAQQAYQAALRIQPRDAQAQAGLARAQAAQAALAGRPAAPPSGP